MKNSWIRPWKLLLFCKIIGKDLKISFEKLSRISKAFFKKRDVVLNGLNVETADKIPHKYPFVSHGLSHNSNTYLIVLTMGVHIYSPALKRWGYTGFELSLIPSVL